MQVFSPSQSFSLAVTLQFCGPLAACGESSRLSQLNSFAPYRQTSLACLAIPVVSARDDFPPSFSFPNHALASAGRNRFSVSLVAPSRTKIIVQVVLWRIRLADEVAKLTTAMIKSIQSLQNLETEHSQRRHPMSVHNGSHTSRIISNDSPCNCGFWNNCNIVQETLLINSDDNGECSLNLCLLKQGQLWSNDSLRL